MDYQKDKLLYEGKAKKIFSVLDAKGSGDSGKILMEFKDDLTAFNGEKKGNFSGKDVINRDIASLIFRYLKQEGIDSHWVEDIGTNEMLSLNMEIIPLEVVVRNILAGSTAKKFSLEEGGRLENPLVELFYKDDDLGDPFINDEQALMLKSASKDELRQVKEKALAVNQALIPFFQAVGIQLVDFKLEFGRLQSDKTKILLADEVTPDTCRLWTEDGEKLDKDRFRRNLGGVKEGYEKVREQIFSYWSEKIS